MTTDLIWTIVGGAIAVLYFPFIIIAAGAVIVLAFTGIAVAVLHAADWVRSLWRKR